MIGRRCRVSDGHSRALLIARKLPPRAFPPISGIAPVECGWRERRLPQACTGLVAALFAELSARRVRHLPAWFGSVGDVFLRSLFLVRVKSHRPPVWRATGHNSGGYSCGAPPLPIPNREVKPARADGTAPQSGRVGRRRLIGSLLIGFPMGRLFFLCPSHIGYKKPGVLFLSMHHCFFHALLFFPYITGFFRALRVPHAFLSSSMHYWVLLFISIYLFIMHSLIILSFL